jgi:hypothetical protein
MNDRNPTIPSSIHLSQLGPPCQQKKSTLQNSKMNLSQSSLILFLPFIAARSKRVEDTPFVFTIFVGEVAQGLSRRVLLGGSTTVDRSRWRSNLQKPSGNPLYELAQEAAS